MSDFQQNQSGLYVPNSAHAIDWQEAAVQLASNQELLVERLAALELALEDVNWIRISGEMEREFSREGIRRICELSRLYYLKNPLVQRGVNVQRDYVFGQGVTIRADAEQVNDVVQTFLDDAKNQAELTSHQAFQYKEVDLAVEGNIFFVFFPNPANGRVRVRTIPVDEIDEIICNPDDAKDPWFYKRVWTEKRLELESGRTEIIARTVYYPDWRYTPSNKPQQIGGKDIRWDSPVYHVRVGGLSNMRFGVSEVYAAIDWAKAYKEFLEDWATLTRAYSRFAWQLTTKGGKSGIAAAKTKLNSTLGLSSQETNPAPVTGSTFIASEGTSMTPIKTAGATVSAEDGRRMLLMVAMVAGLPETFYADASVGTLATAKSLDRPTELKMRSRQMLWSDVLTAIINYVIYWSVKSGTLNGQIQEEDDGTPKIILTDLDEDGEPISATVRVEFPPILEHDVEATVRAVAQAAGTGRIDDQTVSRLLLQALGVDDIEAALQLIAEQDEQDAETAAAIAGQEPTTPDQQAQEALIEAAKELRQALVSFKERYADGR